ncbi:hypothetical protein LIER_03629 [Lithospermum erythrorhizon]|uniref:BZIP domain-containing protein n=1 Tax=Lithospermum erythrorhizon TaxID=34254 RepID=A0AAV3NV50_LITER
MDKEERNALRRDRYKANRDEINKRRRKVNSEKRRHLEFANESSSANTVEVHPMLDKLPNCDQNISSINDIPSTTNQHVFHASVLTSSNLCSVVANDAAIEHRLTDWHIERTFETVNNNSCDPRTLILPKVSPCKYCGAYKFYRDTDRMCCAGGQIVLAESILPEYLVQLITGTDERLTALPRLDPSIVEKLVEVFDPNPYSEFLKHASSLDTIDQYHIVLRSDLGIDQRRYNKPTSTEVAGIWIEDESCEANSEL